MPEEKVTYLIVPGWQGSPAEHWQSHWHAQLPNAQRVEQADWQNPLLQQWVDTLQQSIEAASAPVVLVAHSLGCVTVAHWAHQASVVSLGKIRGALLVAPADVERVDCPDELVNFAPVPVQRLPFPSVLVGSSNDHAASAARAMEFAGNWGSEAVILSQVGHINVASGHTRWPEGFVWLYRLQELCSQRYTACA